MLCVLYLDNVNGRVLEASIQESQACKGMMNQNLFG